MNHSIEPVLTPPSLSLFYLFNSLFSLPPVFSSFASRSVLSWNIYSSPGPASLNRHTNLRLNIAQCCLHAFPSVSSPKTQRSAIHTRCALAMSPSASPGSLEEALRRMAVGRKCTHAPRDPPPRLSAAHSNASTETESAVVLTLWEQVLFCHMTVSLHSW